MDQIEWFGPKPFRVETDSLTWSVEYSVDFVVSGFELPLSAKRDRVLAPGERSEPGETEMEIIESPRARAKDPVASFAGSDESER